VDLDLRVTAEPEEVEHVRVVQELRNRPLDDRGVLRVQEVELVGVHRDAEIVPPGERSDRGEPVGEGLPPRRRADRVRREGDEPRADPEREEAAGDVPGEDPLEAGEVPLHGGEQALVRVRREPEGMVRRAADRAVDARVPDAHGEIGSTARGKTVARISSCCPYPQGFMVLNKSYTGLHGVG
jgi:hypothetical protein